MMKTQRTTLSDTPALYPTYNDPPVDPRTELNALMNLRLASAIDLQLQMKQAHWNVKGTEFIGLHMLFGEIDEAVGEYLEMVAERIVQLGGIAEGTVRVAASRSHLAEYPPSLSEGMAHVSAVATALAAFGKEARATIDEAEAFDDADTAELFTEISQGIDKWLWYVEAHSRAIT